MAHPAPGYGPGPAPVANMTEEDPSDAESLISESSSATTSSSEASRAGSVGWSSVGIDRAFIQEALDALGQRVPIPQPFSAPSSPSNTGSAPLPNSRPPPIRQPPPQRLEVDGVKTFVQYLPYWSDPNWNDRHYIFDEDGVEREMVKVHPLDKQRPALLAQDALKRPTPYAKRLGIYPNRTDGRSRMSPSISTTRRVQLPYVTDTPTGRKDFITVEDALPLPGPAGTDQVLQWRDQLDPILAGVTGHPDKVDAFRQLLDSLQQDEALQQIYVNNVTFDEFLAHDVHSVERDGVKYDLEGPLHPLLDRQRWVSPVDRGDTEDNPRLCFQLDGYRGEWCARDDRVWKVIQPALQIATRVLNSNHPVWLALLDAKSRRIVDPSRLPPGTKNPVVWTYFTTSFDPAAAYQPNHPDPGSIGVLDTIGFDLMKAVATYLDRQLTIEFFSSLETWEKGTPVDEIIWGWCRTYGLGNHDIGAIHVRIGAEMVVPLLLSEYTYKEKASCTFMIASAILHELAHAASMALYGFLNLARQDHSQHCHDASSPLYGLSHVAIDALKNLGLALDELHEPFHENDPKAEVGFAMEKALWGGVLESAFNQGDLLYRHNGLMPIALRMSQWPNRSHPHNHSRSWLRDPPIPVDELTTFLPVDTYSKFLDQTFWDCHFKKFGFQALKLHPDTGGLTTVLRNFTRRKDLHRLFGRARGEWLLEALQVLRSLGHGMLHAYCQALLMERMEHIWVRKRFHHEAKVWSWRSVEFDKICSRITELSSALNSSFQKLNSTDTEKRQHMWQENIETYGDMAVLGGQIPPEASDLTAYVASLTQRASGHFKELIVVFLELHHHLLVEIRCAQTLVVDYVQQAADTRQHLYNRYTEPLYNRIEEEIQPAVPAFIETLGHVRAAFERYGPLPQDINDDLARIETYLQLDLNHLDKTKFYLSCDNVEIDNLIWIGELQTVPRGRNKKKTDTMKRMGTTEVHSAEPAVRVVVDTFLKILDVKAEDLDAGWEAQFRDTLTESREQDVTANMQRRADALKAWQETPLHTPVLAGVGYAKPPDPSVTGPSWVSAQVPSPAARGLHWGNTNSLTPVNTPPISPSGAEPATFSSYAGPTSGFAGMSSPESVLRHRNDDNADVPVFEGDDGIGVNVFGGGPAAQPGLRPFGTPWSDTRTVSEELRREGYATPELRNWLGEEVFLRNQAQEAGEESRKREMEAKKSGRYP